MDEVWTDPSRTTLVEVDRFFLDAWQTANAGSDRAAGAQFEVFAHVLKSSIFDRLACCIDTKHDEGIDLTLNLAVDALVRIKAPGMILVLHLARYRALLPLRLEFRNRARAAFTCDQVGPTRFDIAPEGSDQTETGNDNTPHDITPNASQARTRKGLGPAGTPPTHLGKAADTRDN